MTNSILVTNPKVLSKSNKNIKINLDLFEKNSYSCRLNNY